LAELVHGTILGDGDIVIHAAHTLSQAQPGDITFVESGKYVPQAAQSNASAVMVPPGVVIDGKVVIQVPDPLMAFAQVVQQLQNVQPSQPTGIDSRAIIHPSAQIGEAPSIHPFAIVGENTVIGNRCLLHSGVIVGKNCRIGDDVVLYPQVVLYDRIILGDRVIIHANAVIGADGFGYRHHNGKHVKVPHLGHVVIGSDVEIGACATVDRGAFEATQIGDGSKIDNLVQIAHNCQIGQHNLIASQTGIAGSASTGNYVVIGGQVGIKDHLTVGHGAMIGGHSGVIHHVPPRARFFGYPAQNERDIGRLLALMKKLPEMRKDLLRVLQHLGLKQTEAREAAA
jgi:UDP-3-O-[3-hydroxymyristoyl] glucosamine N-acyltransferase